jgi:hypothetical protein
MQEASEFPPADVTHCSPASHAPDASPAQSRALAVQPASGTVVAAAGAQVPGTGVAPPTSACSPPHGVLVARQVAVDASATPHTLVALQLPLKKVIDGAAHVPPSGGPQAHAQEASGATGEAKPV